MSTTQNICFFNTTQFWGGGEKWHFEAAVMCSETQHNTFFVVDGQGELAKRLESFSVSQLHTSVNNRSFLNPIKVAQLVTFFTKNKIDTVIFNSPKDLKLGGKAAKKAGVKNIVYRRGIAVEVKKKPLNEKLFKEVVTHFIFNSKATKALLEKNFKAIIDTKQTAIIYNATEFPPNTQPFNSNSPIVIGNAGRLVEQKGQHFLIDIAEKLKENKVGFKIKIAGDGPFFNDLSEKIKAKNLTNEIELLGFVEDMTSFMQSIDIFVSTALWEGFGFVLAEAMAQQKPVLAFNLSSNPELVKDGENGYLIEPENTTEFAEKLTDLISDASQRETLGKNAYQFAKINFEKQQQFQKLMEFIAK
jgi:glycosyltransferase involved in cell wall biosynthesis